MLLTNAKAVMVSTPGIVFRSLHRSSAFASSVIGKASEWNGVRRPGQVFHQIASVSGLYRLTGTGNRHKPIQKSHAEVRNCQSNLSYAKSAGMRKS